MIPPTEARELLDLALLVRACWRRLNHMDLRRSLPFEDCLAELKRAAGEIERIVKPQVPIVPPYAPKEPAP